MTNTVPALLAGAAAFLIYLALSAGTASAADAILAWSSAEIIIGLILSIITGILCRKLWTAKHYTMANPLRWLLLIVYIVPFVIELIIANLKVSAAILTGRNIRPGIIKLSPGLKTTAGTLLLSASITYQPGTATVEVNEKTRELYIHCLDIGKEDTDTRTPDCIWSKINLAKWIRRINE